MDPTILKLAVAGVVGAHGIGHVLGWMPAVGMATFDGVSGRSWALTGMVGEHAARVAAGLLFVVPTIGFAAAAVALLAGVPWWRQVAVVSAVVSLGAMALYPQAFPTSSTIGAVAVDLVVLYAVLVAGWGEGVQSAA